MYARCVSGEYYKDEGFFERKIDINEGVLQQIIEEYLDPDHPERDGTQTGAEIEVAGDHDDNPMGRQRLSNAGYGCAP